MANKITKKDNFNAIIEVLKENGKTELVKVMEHELELMNAKSGKKSEKVVAEQNAIDSVVLGALTLEGTTVTEIYKKIGMPEGTTVPKITASLGRLVKAGKAVNDKSGKSSLYSLAPSEEVAE